MKILSVNVGRPRPVSWNDRVVPTAIFKDPVSGTVHVHGDNIDGDQQADLTVHGGPGKAIYAYPSEHYEFWRHRYPGPTSRWGAFGENLTIRGLVETDVQVGDVLSVGSVQLRVTQPRMPCFKLGIRFGDPGLVKEFYQSARLGFYLGIVQEGEFGAGTSLEFSRRQPDALSIADIVALSQGKDPDISKLRAAVALPWLGPEWRDRLNVRLQRLDPAG